MAAYDYVLDTGLIVPDTADTLSEVEQEFKDVLGQDLVVTADTPQGVLIVGETTARTGVATNNAQVANQINPGQAGGVFLEALCALMGLEREKATQTIVPNVEVSGDPATVLPPGSKARDTSGNICESINQVIFDGGGNGVVNFRAIEYGPIIIAINTLTAIVDTDTLGWETVNNPDECVPGRLEQSDEALRAIREETLARQSISGVEAQISGLYDPKQTPGVRSLQFRENIEPTTEIIDGISLVAHSVWACVDGGADQDIAMTLLKNKTDGANWNGAVTVNVIEPSSGQTYPVKFDRPDEVGTKCRVTLRTGSTGVTDPAVIVPQSVVNYANGLVPGDKGFATGVSISPFEIAAAINYYNPGYYVKKVEIATLAGAFSTNNLPIAIDEVGRITLASVVVVLEA